MKRAGLSLLEVLVTLGLISVVLAITSDLLIGYAQTSRSVRRSNAGLHVLHLLTDTINSELKSAVVISTPAVGDNGNTLVLQRVDPGVNDRLTFFPPPIPGQWTPYDYPSTPPPNDFLSTVTYSLNGRSLERAVVLALGASSETAVVAQHLGNFEVSNLGAFVETTITVDVHGVPKTYSSTVMRRIRP